jgi:hypothetical protein
MTMSEAEWLASNDTSQLLAFAQDKLSDRKLRLFVCAACRQLPLIMREPRSAHVLAVAEKFADESATMKEVTLARSAVEHVPGVFIRWSLAWEIRRLLMHSLPPTLNGLPADALRHIAGNPWRPVHIDDGHPDNWHVYPEEIEAVFIEGPLPRTIVALAESLYAGQNCAFALADALREHGQVLLADHFQHEPEHPRGCWALDVILGKS